MYLKSNFYIAKKLIIFFYEYIHKNIFIFIYIICQIREIIMKYLE